MTNLTLIAAVAEKSIIGNGPDIPWERIPEDMRRFRKLTMGHPVLVGRRTYESLPKAFRPLPGRKNIVISRSPENIDYSKGVITCHSIPEAISKGSDLDKDCYVIGGSQIYEQTIGLSNRLEITEVHQTVEGDAFFPFIDRSVWEEIQREDSLDEGYSFVTYKLRF